MQHEGALRTLAAEHADAVIGYAVIGGFDNNEIGFYFGCPEFEQEEDLITVKIVASSIDTYRNEPVDLEAVKRDMQKLTDGILLSGNA